MTDELKRRITEKVKDVVASELRAYSDFEGYKPTIHNGRNDREILIILTPLENGPKRLFSVKITEL
jgi:hypothetical protein